jgi:hypothetical protein
LLRRATVDGLLRVGQRDRSQAEQVAYRVGDTTTEAARQVVPPCQHQHAFAQRQALRQFEVARGVDEPRITDQHVDPAAGARLREDLLQVAVAPLDRNAGLVGERPAQRLGRALVSGAGEQQQRLRRTCPCGRRRCEGSY